MLVALVIAAVLPMLAFATFMSAQYARDQRVQYEHQMLSTTQSAMVAVDAALEQEIAILRTLSHANELRDQNWRAFYELSKGAIADQPRARINLYDIAGHIIFSTLLPFDTPQFNFSGSMKTIEKVVATGQPQISDLFVGAASKELVVAVYVPVFETGKVINVLSISVPPDFLAKVVHSQSSSEDHLVLVDRKGTIIARTRGNFTGQQAASGLWQAAQQTDQGVFETINVQGISVRGTFSRSSLSGWTTALGNDKSDLNRPFWRFLFRFGGGGALLFAAALVLALYYGRRIVRSVTTLTHMAKSLGRGDVLPRSRLNLSEMQIIGDQMSLASRILKRQASEREDLLSSLEHRVLERTKELEDYKAILEETVNARTRQLTESNQQLEAANKELEGFSYSVSHDLRTPLRAIDGFSRILADEHASELSQEGLRVLDIILANTAKMSRLIDDILAFSRMGRAELKRAEIDMQEMVQTTYAELQTTIARRSIEFKVGALPRTFADSGMVKQVIVNLLDNAIKYSAPVPNACIEVEGRIENSEAVYVVKDNGVGFDMKYAGKLFGVFQRLHSNTEFSGTGIGLSIVKRIITRHGGRVWADGKQGQGATFGFALPIMEAVNA